MAVGGHPMCGKERGGLEQADPQLYRNAPFVLTPTRRTTPEALALATALALAVGARPCVVEAERHDAAVAAISHVPFLLAVAGIMAAAEQAADDPLPWQLAAGGFRDTTRVAAGEVPVMRDTLLTNEVAVLAQPRARSNPSWPTCGIDPERRRGRPDGLPQRSPTRRDGACLYEYNQRRQRG